MTKTFNRNPNGINQWQQRSNQEIQEIINKFPHFTKKDFRGEGKQNSKKILTRKETERPGLQFKNLGKRKQPLKNVYKHSSYESIGEFEKGLINEDTFRNRARTKKQRDLMPANKKKIFYKKRHENLTETQIKLKQYRDRIYKERLKDS